MKAIKQEIPFLYWLKYKFIYGYSQTGMNMIRDVLSHSCEKLKVDGWSSLREQAKTEIALAFSANSLLQKAMRKIKSLKARLVCRRAVCMCAGVLSSAKVNRKKEFILDFMILPVEFLGRMSLDRGRTWPVPITKFIFDVSNKPQAQVELEFHAKGVPDFTSEELACMLCMGRWSEKAWEKYRQRPSSLQRSGSMLDWGFGEQFYWNFVRLLRKSPFFDSKLDGRFADAVRDLCKWYYMPHAVTGMFYVLEQEPPQSRFSRFVFAVIYKIKTLWFVPYATSAMAKDVLCDMHRLLLLKDRKFSRIGADARR